MNKLEKQHKPVPDVEALRYKGTPDKPDIKIFVSHRIDQDSMTIDNPLYIPIRCGAVYDEREGISMLGDDTGDNISEKRESFCELTVLYWAWKNVKADFYGLCHYRRYISFSDRTYSDSYNKSGILFEQVLSQGSIDKYELENQGKMCCTIQKSDIITTPPEDVTCSGDGNHRTVYGLCEDRRRDFDMRGVELLFEVIEKKYPKFLSSSKKYFNSQYAKFYNCFVMKKELFDEFCEFLFGTLFEVEKKLDTQYYNVWKTRMPGFLGEHLFGIFLEYYTDLNNINVSVRELVFFQETQVFTSHITPAFLNNNIPIVFSSSDYFAPFAAVFIQSVIKQSSKTNNYDFIILESAISVSNKKLLKQLAYGYPNMSIRFFNPKPLLRGAKLFINSANQSEEAYYRVLAPFILSQYDKAIVMDCDLIAKCDIAKLLQTPLNGNVAAIVPDAVWHGWANGMIKEVNDYCKTDFPIKNPFSYVNTGVIVFDCVAYRRIFTVDGIVEYIKNHKFNIQEQDALNLLLEGKIENLDIAWNMYVLSSDFIKQSIDDFAPVYERNAYHTAHENPKLIHWAAQPKPWNDPNVDLGIEWWLVARETPFYELILARMMDTKLGPLHPVVFDLQNRMGIFDTRSGARKFADKILPKGSKRREFVKILLPKGSLRWRFCKQVYYIFKPEYRPKK